MRCRRQELFALDRTERDERGRRRRRRSRAEVPRSPSARRGRSCSCQYISVSCASSTAPTAVACDERRQCDGKSHTVTRCNQPSTWLLGLGLGAWGFGASGLGCFESCGLGVLESWTGLLSCSAFCPYRLALCALPLAFCLLPSPLQLYCPPMSLRRKTILVVDPDEDDARGHRRTAPARLPRAARRWPADTAAEVLMKEEVDVVIAEVALPDMTGVELLQVTRVNFPLTEVIITSSRRAWTRRCRQSSSGPITSSPSR